MNRVLKGIAATGIGALLAAGALIAPVATAALPQIPTVADLRDTSTTQPRWLSVPYSRTVINPFAFEEVGATTERSEIEYSGGTNLPLSNGFYAHDEAIHVKNILNVYEKGAEAPEYSLNESFDSQAATEAAGWTLRDATSVYSGGKVTVTNSGAEWGYLQSPLVNFSPGDQPLLTVHVPSISPANGLWSIEAHFVGGSGPEVVKFQPDSSVTGEFTVELAKKLAEAGRTGAQQFRLRLWASTYNTGSSNVSVTFDSISIHKIGENDFPSTGQAVGWETNFDNVSGWSGPSNGSIVASAGEGVIALGSSGDAWGAATTQISGLNVDTYPLLSLKASSGTGEWAVKVNSGSGDIPLQVDTASHGVFTYNLRALTGWTGSKNFTLKVFQVGHNTSTRFDRIAIHSGGSSSVFEANNVDYAWTPASVTMRGTYDNITVDTEDYFSTGQIDGLVRKISATGDGDLAVGGVLEHSNPAYDAATRTITVTGPYASRSVALPLDSEVRFYGGLQSFKNGDPGTAAPTSSSGYWSAALPADGTDRYIGIAWAVAGESDAATQSRTAARASRDEQASGIAHWTQHWNEYLGSVPALEDYSINRVADGGVQSDRMRVFYFYAWINLEMNVLPATPETGNLYAQVGTGKPSLWMHGTPGTKNVASWDSLLGMQQLVYTNPSASWDSFIGMMKSVKMDGPAPTDTNGVDAKGGLKGESLPSRKAQTAWILYSVTGDEAKLQSIFDELHAHLIWESHNLRWIFGSNDATDERDSEFVASLIYDLKFAVRIADLLGHNDLSAQYTSLITSLTRDYEDWFFPTTQDGAGKVWPTVQKVFLETSRTSIPEHPETEGQPYRDQKGRWVRQGLSYYTTTALVADELGANFKAKVLQRHEWDYDDNRQLAGLGRIRVKAPDVQLITYGLLDAGAFGDYTRQDLLDQANVLVNSFNRDMVIAKWFAEVYHETGNGAVGGHIKASGVRPSLFGISNFIDFMLISNGYRLDEGTPTFLRLEGATGGVSGLTHRNQKFGFDIDGTTIRLSGAAVGHGGLPPTIDVSETGVSHTPEGGYQASTDASLSSLSVGGTSLSGFSAGKTDYAVELPAGTTIVPGVTGIATDQRASVTVTPASALPGTTTVLVTAEDGVTTRTYRLAFTVKAAPVDPSTPKDTTIVAPSKVSTRYGVTARVAVNVRADGAVPSGRVEVRAENRILGSAALVRGRATVSLPKNLAVGRLGATVTYVPTGSDFAASSSSLSVNVTKTKIKKVTARVIKPKKSTKKIMRNNPATVRVVLTGTDGARVTGTVRLTAGKHTLGKAKIKKAGSRFVATVKIKAKATTKFKKSANVTARYSGNGTYKSSNHTTTVKVRIR
ncbi:hypothetical protein GCM10010401_04370 [Rarobacter faecitabidus]|uniref:Ig-like domain-containing protein n=1 Tax=Rarobacter faecitabidus TaxID=13243 RepID=A0A542ZU08_RARFA|nr:Ig-like domain repeat protein [Rarobacter faecitabidus]TQL63807.1 Ig-like domain-containing protein [Rarobacter faecitabidus]